MSKTILQQCNDKGFLRNKHPGHQELLQEVHFKRVNFKKEKERKTKNTWNAQIKDKQH